MKKPDRSPKDKDLDDQPAYQASRWRSRLGCGLAIVFAVAILGLPLISVYFFQSDAEEQLRIQSELHIEALKRLAQIAIASLVVYLLVSALLLLFTRWRRIRVFITFHHSLEGRVLDMSDALRAEGIDCDFIPFDPLVPHDNVLTLVSDKLRRADLVITVPGTEPSFVDSEILSTTTLRKPLLIVIPKGNVRQLHTAFKGYPRFQLERLEQIGYKSFSEFIKHICNHWTFAMSTALSGGATFFLIWSGSGAALIVGSYITDAIAYFAMMISVSASYMVRRFEVYAITTLFIVATVAALAAFGLAVWNRVRARRIARQTTLTGDATYEMLNEAIGNNMVEPELVNCLIQPKESEPV